MDANSATKVKFKRVSRGFDTRSWDSERPAAATTVSHRKTQVHKFPKQKQLVQRKSLSTDESDREYVSKQTMMAIGVETFEKWNSGTPRAKTSLTTLEELSSRGSARFVAPRDTIFPRGKRKKAFAGFNDAPTMNYSMVHGWRWKFTWTTCSFPDLWSWEQRWSLPLWLALAY